MNKLKLVVILCLLSVNSAYAESHWMSLFNGKDLLSWDTYIGPPYVVNKKDFVGEPLGLNNDPTGVFTVVEEDGAPALRISGEFFGGISTKEEYQNYHLTLEFKWGDERYIPRESSKRDSGLLYHAVGPHAAGWFFWMRSIELQIQEGDCGDYWSLAGSVLDIAAKKEGDEFVYDAKSPKLNFSHLSENGGHVKKANNTFSEKPHGQWNTIELYTVGNTSVHVVNSVPKMVLNNTRQIDNGKERPLVKGKIQLQSEGAEIFYRNIKIEKIDSIPKALLIF